MNKTPKAIFFFGGLIAVLLIGQRFGFAWAGGPGYEVQAETFIVQLEGTATAERNGRVRSLEEGDRLSRGETIRTDDGSRLYLRSDFGLDTYLDERTDVTLNDLRLSTYTLHLHRGRLLSNGHTTLEPEANRQPITIETVYTTIAVPFGAVSVVNYDFKQTVGIFPIDTIAAIAVGDDQGWITPEGVEVHEVDPITATDVSFTPDQGAAADFYRWAGVIK